MAICGVLPPFSGGEGGCRLRVPPWGGRVYGFSARASFAYLLIQSNVWRWRCGWRARPRAPLKGVRPNKSARPRNTAVTTTATGKMRSQCFRSIAIAEAGRPRRGHRLRRTPRRPNTEKSASAILIGMISIGR
jgi:hypothetical protein